VARGNGMSVEEVDDLVPDIVEKDFTSRYMSRLRRAAKWVACRIEELENELGYLGSYIFLLCMFPGQNVYKSSLTDNSLSHDANISNMDGLGRNCKSHRARNHKEV
jgi:hypothetical protein